MSSQLLLLVFPAQVLAASWTSLRSTAGHSSCRGIVWSLSTHLEADWDRWLSCCSGPPLAAAGCSGGTSDCHSKDPLFATTVPRDHCRLLEIGGEGTLLSQ